MLDTNVIIRIFAGDPVVSRRIESFAQVFTPVTAVGELYHGAFRSTRRSENIARLERYLATAVVLPCVDETARHYGRFKAALVAKGRPIPENDIWIAALAAQHELTVLTRDLHFREVEGLTMELLE